MEWQVDPGDARAPYDQLRVQIIADIDEGRLAAGERLPTVRELAGRLGLAANTVARAYRELESSGIVETRGRHGTFVLAGAGSVDAKAVETTRDFLGRMRALGIDADDAAEFVRRLGASG